MGLRHERLTDLPQRAAPLAHVATDLPLGDLRAMLSDQPLPHPPRRVPLLARHLQVALKPGVNQRPIRTKLRRRPAHRRPLRRRHRRRQRLPHRTAMHPMTRRQRPDRQPLTIPVPPDLLERLHPGLHPFRGLPFELQEHRTVGRRSDGGGATSSVHTGATSDVRAHAPRRLRQSQTRSIHRPAEAQYPSLR